MVLLRYGLSIFSPFPLGVPRNPFYLSLLFIPSALPNLHLRLLYYIIGIMIFILLRTLFSALWSHRALTLENLALRHQLYVFQWNTHSLSICRKRHAPMGCKYKGDC